MSPSSPLRAGLILILLAFGVTSSAQAKPARCSTTDDGSYNCQFKRIADDGSFVISAPGKPTYILTVAGSDTASATVELGSRNVSLPGLYLRSRSEPGCWVNDKTGAKLCAR